MSSKAPTLNKMAISPQRSGIGQQPPARSPGLAQQPTSAAPPAAAERERVAAAVEFGAALENLVAYARLWHEESDATPRESGPPFPPDLLIHRDPEDLLRSTCQKLLKLEPTLLGLDQPDRTMPPTISLETAKPSTPNGHSAPVRLPNPDRPFTRDSTSAPGGPPSPDEPSTEQPTPASPSTKQSEEMMLPPESLAQYVPSTSNGTSAPERASIGRPDGIIPAPLPGPSRKAISSSAPGPLASTGTPIQGRPSIPPRPQVLPRLPTPIGPSKELKVKEKVDTLLRASAQG